ncbi:anaerobic sulfatase maturase [Paraliobacillus salinarum]|uniref:anaerobic sulfatase maturase n=1 Tax=Paraliobacillus salinarum TaxID=1158996 RepID=UPI0015F6AE98|nr:anaerobic sulfatase maturase [Paraliobacillus salinarum]
MSDMTTLTKKTGLSGIMWKTVSESCNLACDYCYYSRCNGKAGKIDRIDDKLLEKVIKEYMEMSSGLVTFAWQGGEPLLAGIDFFKKVVYLQSKYAKANTIISNSIQTNGLLLNQEWATFFKQYNFLVGVSLDGPAHINDARRVTSSGKGSFHTIIKGIQYLKDAHVPFNILTVLHENNITCAAELMNFYQDYGFDYVQFIPCMDFQSQDIYQSGDYLITPKQYGDFLCEAFDHWYNDGHPEISIRFFDHILAVNLNQPAGMCTHMETCPKTVILEQNGDAYPCDFYIHEDYRLGNVNTNTLESIVNDARWEQFTTIKPALPDKCKSCEFLHLCHGGCPRNRQRESNQMGVDYFCDSYQQVYRYAHSRIQDVAQKVRKNRIHAHMSSGAKLPERNDPCLCGSGKKFKKCCQTLLEKNNS